MKELPNKPVFTITTDDQGRKYYVAYSNKETNTILCRSGVNHQYRGNSKLIVRVGDSKFDDEFILAFNIHEKTKTYLANSKHDVIEIYFPKERGIEFFKNALEHFEKNIRG